MTALRHPVPWRIAAAGRLRRRPAAFSMVELLAVLAVTMVLFAAASSGFRQQQQRVRRADARVALLDLAARQAEHQLREGHYAASAAALLGADGELPSPGGHYLLRIDSEEAAAAGCEAAEDGHHYCYVLSARPVGPQALDGRCAVFLMDHTGGKRALDADGEEGEGCW